MASVIDPTIEKAITKKPAPAAAAPVTAPPLSYKPQALTAILIVMAIILVAILMARSVYNPPAPVAKAQLVKYNGYNFTELADHFWQFDWQKDATVYSVPLRYNPTQLADVQVTGDVDAVFGTRPAVYIAVDPSNQTDQAYVALGVGELGINLNRVFGVMLVGACTRNETLACATRPIVTCADTDKSVIVVHEGPGPLVNQTGNCITLQGNQLGVLQAVDRLLYRIYGIMP